LGGGRVWARSSSGTSYVHNPAKTGPANGNFTALANERGLGFYSTAPGDSPAVHDQLLDRALAKIQFELPANLKSQQLASVKSLRRWEANRTELVQPREESRKKAEVPDMKPCRGSKCPHLCGRDTNGHCITGGNWRMSEQLYGTIQLDCGYLNQQLAREERKAATNRARRDTECLTNALGSGCSSTTRAVDKTDAKISQLHDRYDWCVLQDLRHKASLFISDK
jgi:hypothetical protein